jgi:NAD(P)-dependent dehydrogenase (short-subunit alcohol dehydrogenase family)
MKPKTFDPGIALVFGGSGGIGAAICRRFAAAGCDVALTYRSNRKRADDLVNELSEQGCRARAFQVELSRPESVQGVFAALAELPDRVHTVVYSTGADISMVHLSNVDTEEWLSTIDGDLNGFFHVVKAAIPMLRRGGGSVVAITSAGISRHPPLDILSVAPKAGIEALVRAIAREEGRYGIRANSVAPGVVDGGLFHRLTPQVSPDFVEAMKRNTALRRFGTADEIASVAVFLASPDAAYVTGQHLAVDGGFSV